jgi:hypothetical protein
MFWQTAMQALPGEWIAEQDFSEKSPIAARALNGEQASQRDHECQKPSGSADVEPCRSLEFAEGKGDDRPQGKATPQHSREPSSATSVGVPVGVH